MKYARAIAILPAAALILAGAGCGPTISNGTVSVQQNGNSASYTDTSTNSQMNVGENVSLPPGFPTDVPQYPNGKLTSALNTGSGSTGSQLTFTTADSASTVAAWYNTTLTAAGWTSDSNYNASGMSIASYQKAGATISVTVSDGSDGSETSGVVSYSPATAQ